jgi:hypothetical protein
MATHDAPSDRRIAHHQDATVTCHQVTIHLATLREPPTDLPQAQMRSVTKGNFVIDTGTAAPTNLLVVPSQYNQTQIKTSVSDVWVMSDGQLQQILLP